MLKPQEHIDLSLKLIKRTGIKKNESPIHVRRIEVAEIEQNTSNPINHSAAQPQNRPKHKHMHMTRVARKMLTVQVSEHGNRVFMIVFENHIQKP